GAERGEPLGGARARELAGEVADAEAGEGCGHVGVSAGSGRRQSTVRVERGARMLEGKLNATKVFIAGRPGGRLAAAVRVGHAGREPRPVCGDSAILGRSRAKVRADG